LYLPDVNFRLQDPQIFSEALLHLGGTHLMSSLEIANAPAIGLHFLSLYQDEHTPLRVYLYEVIGK